MSVSLATRSQILICSPNMITNTYMFYLHVFTLLGVSLIINICDNLVVISIAHDQYCVHYYYSVVVVFYHWHLKNKKSTGEIDWMLQTIKFCFVLFLFNLLSENLLSFAVLMWSYYFAQTNLKNSK